MKFAPKYYKTHPLSLVVQIESVQDSLGNIFYCVSSKEGERRNYHFMFKHLSSAIDFVECNFK